MFDPLNAAYWPEPMVWDPTAGAQDPNVASARGLAFAGGLQVDNDKDGAFFQAQAGIIMARLLRAAAIDGRGMDGVIDWATDLKAAANRAVQILKRDPVTENWGTTLHTAITGADETVSSVRMTMAQKIEPFLNPVVMRQLIPAAGVEMFDPATFVRSTDTLILLTDDQAQTNVAPLTTMLLNEVMDAAKHAAAISDDRPAGPAAARRGRRDRERRAGAEAAGDAQRLPGHRGAVVPGVPVRRADPRQVGGTGGLRDPGEPQLLHGSRRVCRTRRPWSGSPASSARWRCRKSARTSTRTDNVASQRMVTESERTVLRPEEVRRLVMTKRRRHPTPRFLTGCAPSF